ncbi:precorrin-3B C(17)-methyltransferase [Deinococcus sp.]|uniref:precorrin-3B C(17)-methyltransferase n=1 Tax=Deinococcus sp. TaxID=47478 RepID=UPI0025BFD390|nr:precorrin-3B C(17)-methyltransferase [Deinococcus sp.]
MTLPTHPESTRLTPPSPRPGGHLSLVSVGPGDLNLVPQRAREALTRADVIVAYDLYLRWVAPLLDPARQEIVTLPLTREKRRAEVAIERAAAGQRTALVSSGDIGIYAMAGLVFEDLPDPTPFTVEVIPGITSATACASLLGSPLTHDFATLSLSDLLCPWEWIEHRASHIAQADLSCVLYNVQSRARQEGVYRVLRLMLAHKRPDTVCGVVRNAYREDQEVRVTTLEALLDDQFDMLTTIVIGNRFTQRRGRWMFTPRGYNAWEAGRDAPTAATPAPYSPAPHSPAPHSPVATEAAPEHAGRVWVFAGTSDGSALAQAIAGDGLQVTLSVATALGASVAPQRPGVQLYSGPAGVQARRLALRGARAVVDATHPYAQIITAQLRELCEELGVPYLRLERPASLESDPAQQDGVSVVDDLSMAATQAAARGGPVFLATGSRDLDAFWTAFLAAGGLGEQVFVRLTPQPDVLARALALGVPARNVSALIGPFSREFNEAQWRAQGIRTVITRDSGDEGGFDAKRLAARALDAALIVLRRPDPVPGAFHDPQALRRALLDLAARPGAAAPLETA